MKKIWDNYESLFYIIIIAIVFGACWCAIGYTIGYNRGKKQKEIIYTPPIEKEVIDTLYITKDKLITKIKYLETIKHDTIEKVYILDDSATVELFYKLVSEQTR